MAKLSSTERSRLSRLRKKTGESVPVCRCGKQIRGKLSRMRSLCSYCWNRSPEGKAETLKRVRKHRKLGESSNG